ncbi:hypothetical protein FB451DRAFT_1182755 [Mycena latifolia]|nr:hypothetical protein FB451DRAFT_1182755 [Mycena latifolia]
MLTTCHKISEIDHKFQWHPGKFKFAFQLTTLSDAVPVEGRTLAGKIKKLPASRGPKTVEGCMFTAKLCNTRIPATPHVEYAPCSLQPHSPPPHSLPTAAAITDGPLSPPRQLSTSLLIPPHLNLQAPDFVTRPERAEVEAPLAQLTEPNPSVLGSTFRPHLLFLHHSPLPRSGSAAERTAALRTPRTCPGQMPSHPHPDVAHHGRDHAHPDTCQPASPVKPLGFDPHFVCKQLSAHRFLDYSNFNLRVESFVNPNSKCPA